MPSKSPEQRAAMRAACGGRSTIGIPRKVGCEYARADAKARQRARHRKRT